jgi:hypothetical protein
MKEFFVIKTGTSDYDDDVDELNMVYSRQRFALGMILFGGFLVLAALM